MSANVHDGAPIEPPADPAAQARRLAETFARGRRVLTALCEGAPPDGVLLVACDPAGFPTAQALLRPENTTPTPVVIGRHGRCNVALPNDRSVSLRHLLLTVTRRPVTGVQIRGFDLGGRAGVVLPDGRRVEGFTAMRHAAAIFGNSSLFVLPTGKIGASLLEAGDDNLAFSRLTGLDGSDQPDRAEVRAAVAPPPPRLEARRGFGYRGADPAQPRIRGSLALERVDNGTTVGRLDVDDDSVARGVLVGRYSDRCALGIEGRNLSRVHALVTGGEGDTLWVFDLASTNGVRPTDAPDGPSVPAVPISEERSALLGHYRMLWHPA